MCNKKTKTRTVVTTTATLELDEQQLRALHAIVGYGTDSFLNVFYSHLGKHYLKPHEQGVVRLFEEIRAVCGPAIRDCDTIRDLLRQSDKTGSKKTNEAA